MKYWQTRLAINSAGTVDQVLAIRERALFNKFVSEALGSRESAIRHAELTIRAERRLGQLLNAAEASAQ